ncbi:MAG: DEAD/DEAH box helicase [Verrucomicrobiota bacterium]
MNPIKAAQEIEKRLQNYIRMTLPVDRSMPDTFTEKLNEFYPSYHLTQDPFLELMPAYAPGSSLQELADEGVIHQQTAQIFANALRGGSAEQPADPRKFTLYAHQTEAIREVCGRQDNGGAFHQTGKNLVVCSGTGSGKTETFLIPLVDYLVRQWDAAGRPVVWNPPGVRAMLLYPMNALVNDQIRRLRQILQHAPFIRFGKYTGELDQISEEQGLSQEFVNGLNVHVNAIQPQDGVKWSGAGFDDEAGLPNEIHQRSVWQDNPGHILVTNYSMLEHMLLKPENDAVFGNTWKFIILDEAHCYTGAVGTEIAWLIRRLERRLRENQGFHPDRLRFLATSATLFDDPDLTEDAQKREIKSRFASKVFPANADSFHVQFGVPASHQPPVGAANHANPLAPEVYAGLLAASVTTPERDTLRNNLNGLLAGKDAEETNLFELSQLVLGLERWLDRLKRVQEFLQRAEFLDNNPIAAGDANYLLQAVQDAVKARLVVLDNPDAIKRNFLADNSLQNMQSLVRFLQAGIGRIDRPGLDDWRDYLHDDSDPRPSNYPGDTIAVNGINQPNPRGNRLRTLLEWEGIMAGDLGQLTVDGFSRLLNIAAYLAVSVEQEEGFVINPKDVPITFSAAAHDALTQFADRLAHQAYGVSQARITLNTAWLRVLLDRNLIAQDTPLQEFESLLALALGGDPRLGSLTCFLARQPKTMLAAADNVFADSDQRPEHLNNLISLASMAVPAGGRRPLLDIRYHQLLRGIDRLGLVFSGEAGGPLGFSLTSSTAEEVLPDGAAEQRPVFDLGVCRDCGQPFVLGYTEVQDLRPHNEAVRLRRERSDTHSYLHAFAWEAGARLEDAEEDPKVQDAQDPAPHINNTSVFFNIRTGQAQSAVAGGPMAAAGWVPAYWYLSSYVNQQGQEHREFISQCPCCHAKHSADGRRFGVITPYTAEGPQFRVVALDELTRLSDPSSEPSARRKPGMGRKVLAFSDSRRSAASLAFGYQSFFLDSNLPRFLSDAGELLCRASAALSIMPAGPLLIEAFHDSLIDMFLRELRSQILARNADVDNDDEEGIRQMMRRRLDRRGCDAASLALSVVMEHQHNCGRLLEISGQDNMDLPKHDAAAVLVLRALVRKGRYSLLRNGVVQLESRHLTTAQVQGQLTNMAGERNLNPQALKDICQEIYQYLFQTARLNMIANWPPDEINKSRFGDKKRVHRDMAGDRLIRFVTGNQPTSSKLNRIVRDRLLLDGVNYTFAEASNLLGNLWEFFVPNGNNCPLAAVGGNGEHEFNINDLRLTFVANAAHANAINECEQQPPHEREDCNRMTREVIPVRIEEHTAQISTEKAAAYQRGFTDGSINILSCTTTFEMGVDLGDLATVYLANLPPGTANYRQRAGRAGRRPGASAYVLTFVSGSAHDEYFSAPERAIELLFGRMSPPLIYLENFTYRARHLRAEALHKFLSWAEEGNRLNVQANGANLARKWNSAGQFFKGMKVGRRQGQGCPIRAVFDPVVSLLADWYRAQQEAVQAYMERMADVPNGLGYSVAADLVWQLLHQGDNHQGAIAPYPVANEEAYRMLGGANIPQPVGEPFSVKRTNVQNQFWGMFNSQNIGAAANTVKPAAAHLLRETTIEWLARTRVLPRYGFPVDVIQLLPHPDDRYAKNVELDRDLKLGLYEYAPGQTVIADNRMFESNQIVQFVRPGVQDQHNNNARVLHICSNCHEVYREQPPNNQCPLCNVNGNQGPAYTEPITVVEPDAFQALMSRSSAGQQNHAQRGTAQNIYTGGLRGPERFVDNMSLATAESASGTIGYVNQGPNYQGFGNQGHSLYHEVHTDVAVWLPRIQLFQAGGSLHRLNHPGNLLAEERLRLAMLSALEAILREAAQQLQVSPQDIGGLLHPHPQADGIGAWVFVLFDASPGGGGTVLPLVLSGNIQADDARHKLIRSICDKARDKCRQCIECGRIHGADAPTDNLVPLTRENFEANQQGQYRRRQSCYRCLRSYQNQRRHDLMDRFDAALVFDALLQAGGHGAGAGVPVSQPPTPLLNLPISNEFELASCTGIDDGPRRFRRLDNGEAVSIGKYLVRLADGRHFLGRLNPNFSPMNFSYNDGVNQYCSVAREQVVARLVQ